MTLTTPLRVGFNFRLATGKSTDYAALDKKHVEPSESRRVWPKSLIAAVFNAPHGTSRRRLRPPKGPPRAGAASPKDFRRTLPDNPPRIVRARGIRSAAPHP